MMRRTLWSTLKKWKKLQYIHTYSIGAVTYTLPAPVDFMLRESFKANTDVFQRTVPVNYKHF